MPRYITDIKNLEKYIAAIVAELQQPAHGDSIPTEFGEKPVIFEEPTYLGRIGVTAIWDGWRDISGEARGRVILEAYKRVDGEEKAQNIGIAMGLTRDQYARIRAQAG